MELEILQLIKQSPGTLFSCKEVGKMLDRPAFRENPSWARPALDKLVSEGQIWKEHSFYFYPTDEQKEQKPRPRRG